MGQQDVNVRTSEGVGGWIKIAVGGVILLVTWPLLKQLISLLGTGVSLVNDVEGLGHKAVGALTGLGHAATSFLGGGGHVNIGLPGSKTWDEASPTERKAWCKATPKPTGPPPKGVPPFTWFEITQEWNIHCAPGKDSAP